MGSNTGEWEELLESVNACELTEEEEDRFFRYVASRLDDVRRSYETAREEKRLYNIPDTQEPFRYVKPYIQSADVPLEEDWNRLEEGYYEIKTTPYEDLWKDVSRDLGEITAGSLATLVLGGYAALTGSLESGAAASITGSGTAARLAQLYNSEKEVRRALRHHWEDGEAPPNEEDMLRLGEIQEDLRIGPAHSVMRDIDGVVNVPGYDLEDIDMDNLSKVSADDMPDGCELRAIVYQPTLGTPE